MVQERASEYHRVEVPFIEQLQSLGWDYLEGDTGVPYLTERETFRQVLLLDRLRAAISRINPDRAGNPWLDDARISQAVGRLQRPGKPALMAANREITRLLIKGTQVRGPDDGKAVPIHYIDYDHPERIDFLVVNQFRVDPPWASGSGYVVESLEAALWCFWRTEGYRATVLRAANLGQDADTTAAVCGQLAGAYYGVVDIPAAWLERLAKRELIEGMATALYEKRERAKQG